MTPIDKARALLEQDPLPEDVIDQLEALAEEAGPDFERVFDDLFEVLFVKFNT